MEAHNIVCVCQCVSCLDERAKNKATKVEKAADPMFESVVHMKLVSSDCKRFTTAVSIYPELEALQQEADTPHHQKLACPMSVSMLHADAIQCTLHVVD